MSEVSGPLVVSLGILAVSFVLFLIGRLGPDLIAMLVLAALLATGVIGPSEAFTGFSSPAVVTIAGLMVIGYGLKQTGVIAYTARRLGRLIRRRYHRLVLVNTVIPGFLSGFINTVAAASFFIPVVLRLCKHMKVPQSRLLLPMAAATLIGANLSLIGASHNLVVDSLLQEATGSGFGFFEFFPAALVLFGVTLIYVSTVGQRLLPGAEDTPAPEEVPFTPHLIDLYELEDRLYEIWVSDVIEEDDRDDTRLEVLDLEPRGLIAIALVREGELTVFPEPDLILRGGDTLLLQGREALMQTLVSEHDVLSYIGPPESRVRYPLSTAELAEAVVPPRSPAIGRTISDLELTKRYGTTAVAYYRNGRPYRTGVGEAVLEEGDAILLYGPRDRIREFDPEKELLIYFKPGEPGSARRSRKKGPLAAVILLLVIALAAIGWLPIEATAIIGAVAMVVVGIVPLYDVYRSIDWRTLVLIGGMYPLGIALNQTGAANLLSSALAGGLGGLGPLAVLAAVVALSMILTQPIHNAAVAIIMTPVAINAADLVGADPKGFAVGVLFGCSAAVLMPYGHPASFLVQEPGGYELRDYLRFGAGLTILSLIVTVAVVPFFWPL